MTFIAKYFESTYAIIIEGDDIWITQKDLIYQLHI